MSEMDGLNQSVSELSVYEREYDIVELWKPTRIALAGWKKPPLSAYLDPEKICLDEVSKDIAFGLEVSSLPAYTGCENGISFKVDYNVRKGPQPKPNLLVAILSSYYAGEKPLDQYDIIMPRNPLKSIAMGEKFEIFIWKSELGPLFIDRADGYGSLPCSVGSLFEKNVTKQNGEHFHRIYSVFHGTIAKTYRLLLTGEVDACLPKASSPVLCELKTISKTKKCDDGILTEHWLQSYLAGIEDVILGKYSQQDKIVRYAQNDVIPQTLSDYTKAVSSQLKLEAFQRMKQLFDFLFIDQKSFIVTNTVYFVSGVIGESMQVTPSPGKPFAVSEDLLKKCEEYFASQKKENEERKSHSESGVSVKEK